VRPCSTKKPLISELDTFLRPFSFVGGQSLFDCLIMIPMWWIISIHTNVLNNHVRVKSIQRVFINRIDVLYSGHEWSPADPETAL
jgi:hypothetical protein